MSSGVIHAAICTVCRKHSGYSHDSVDNFVCSKCIAPRGVTNLGTVSSRKNAKRLETLRPTRKQSIVKDFTPSGRSGLYIYAVVIRQHPDKVKIGMTRKWSVRRRAYACWDLSAGDAIVEERVFCINEEFVDLERLEAHILQTFDAPRAFGSEWFHETIDEAARHIDRIMCANGISYDL